MFRIRVLEHGGKRQEWRKINREIAKAHPEKTVSQVANEARRRMGYIGTKDERIKYIDWIEQKKLAQDNNRASRERGRVREFEAALELLPDSCDPSDSVQWVQAHPAMSRKGRMKEKDAVVMLSAEDILCPPHGRAPSRYAATALQTWVNHPSDFFRLILNEHKKKSGQDEERKDAAADMAKASIRALLSSLQSTCDTTT
jgi:hypothetical protein